jgi:uncharacterized protein YciI
MHFVITCIDKPGQPDLRPANRGEHIEYLKRHADKILCAGPTLGADDVPNGSLLIMDFEDVQAAKDFAEGDPYNKAGVFESVGITPWKKVFPKD